MKQNYRVTSELGLDPSYSPFYDKTKWHYHQQVQRGLVGWKACCLPVPIFSGLDWPGPALVSAAGVPAMLQRLPRNPQKSQEIPKRNPESVRMGWSGLGQHWQQRGVALLLPTEAPPQLTSHGRPWAVGSWTGVLSVGREQLRG